MKISVVFAAVICVAPAIAYASPPSMSSEVRRELMQRFLRAYDTGAGGWSRETKKIEPDHLELAMVSNERGAISSKAMAQKTLLNAIALIDPAWGGVYSCSLADADWKQPLFEKRTSDQAKAIRIYSLASLSFGSKIYLDAARAIAAYSEVFLRDGDGAFFAGQAGEIDGELSPERYFSLDDAARRTHGVPELDRRVITGDNGAMIAALTLLYGGTGEQRTLKLALGAAEAMIARRKLPAGGYRSSDEEFGPLALSDNLEMGRAMLELYTATANERWLAEAEDIAAFITRTFAEEDGGFASVLVPSPIEDEESDAAIDPVENAAVARFANLLHHETSTGGYKSMTQHAMRAVLRSAAIESLEPLPSVLLAERELRVEPRKMIIVGKRSDPKARALHLAALSRIGAYRTLEWVEPGPAPLRYAYFRQPRPQTNAAITCQEDQCAPPAFEVSSIDREWGSYGDRD